MIRAPRCLLRAVRALKNILRNKMLFGARVGQTVGPSPAIFANDGIYIEFSMKSFTDFKHRRPPPLLRTAAPPRDPGRVTFLIAAAGLALIIMAV